MNPVRANMPTIYVTSVIMHSMNLVDILRCLIMKKQNGRVIVTCEGIPFRQRCCVYNVMSAGAYRGYGATQGLFAVESAVNELAAKLHMDPFELRMKNIVKEGDVMPAYYGR